MGVDPGCAVLAVSEASVLEDVGHVVLDQPGLVGVPQVVNMQSGRDGFPSALGVTGDGG